MNGGTVEKKRTTKGTWRLSLHGLKTVAGLELQRRVRSRRWLVALAVWFVIVGAVVVLRQQAADADQAGSVFELVVMLALGAGLLVAPAFTATSINDDRRQGRLAAVQATRLSPAEIVAGKLVAAWCAAAAFLVVTAPFAVWAMVVDDVPVGRALVCCVMVGVETAVVGAVGLGFSSLSDRSAVSTALTYVVVVGLSVLTLLAPMLTSTTETVRVYGPSAEWWEQLRTRSDDASAADGAEDQPGPPECSWSEVRQDMARPERTWWMMVPSPFVVVADAAAFPWSVPMNHRWQGVVLTDLNPFSGAVSSDGQPLTDVRRIVHEAAAAPELEYDQCAGSYSIVGYGVTQDGVITAPDGSRVDYVSPVTASVDKTPVWLWGLAADLLLGGIFFWIAVRRLRLPHKKMPQGIRLA